MSGDGNVAIPGADNSFALTLNSDVTPSLDDVYAHKVGLYLAGCVDYSDSSRKPWYRTQVFELFIPSSALGFITHTSGNDAW